MTGSSCSRQMDGFLHLEVIGEGQSELLFGRLHRATKRRRYKKSAILLVAKMVLPPWLSPDGKTLAVAMNMAGSLFGQSVQQVALWDWTTGKPGRVFPCQSWPESLAFSPDGGLLAVSEENENKRGRVKIWIVER